MKETSKHAEHSEVRGAGVTIQYPPLLHPKPLPQPLTAEKQLERMRVLVLGDQSQKNKREKFFEQIEINAKGKVTGYDYVRYIYRNVSCNVWDLNKMRSGSFDSALSMAERFTNDSSLESSILVFANNIDQFNALLSSFELDGFPKERIFLLLERSRAVDWAESLGVNVIDNLDFGPENINLKADVEKTFTALISKREELAREYSAVTSISNSLQPTWQLTRA